MIYVLIGMGVFFIILGNILTVNNASTLLAGYNTMSEAERKKVDIQAFVPYFRQFHIFLGVSFLVLGLLLHYVFGESVSGIFIAVYPLIAYAYFMWTSSQFTQGKTGVPLNKVAVYSLVGITVFLLGFIFYSLQESKLSLQSNAIAFSGLYGSTLKTYEIESIEEVASLPDITARTNGFALGATRKGFFQTTDDEKVKLMVHTETGPFVQFVKKDGQKLYYSSKNRSAAGILESLRQKYPELIK